MPADYALKQDLQRRLEQERRLLLPKVDGLRVVLASPTPYTVAMSSLGFQTVYRICNETPGVRGERSFLPEDPSRYTQSRLGLLTLESLTPVAEADVLAVSLSYELELMGFLQVLALAGIPLRREARGPEHPLVLVGGPLTQVNIRPLEPFADLFLLGEAEGALEVLLQELKEETTKARQLSAVRALPGVYIPSLHEGVIPVPLEAPANRLPAASCVVTPHTELANMFLIEVARGCSHGCTFCVMRRSEGRGMRVVPKEDVLNRIPDTEKRIGLVGAAVTDHPDLDRILEALIARGCEVGASSLRADRLTLERVQLFRKAGYRQLTVAADGPSERLRTALRRGIKEQHLLSAAQHAVSCGMQSLKIYVMLGVPDETEEDMLELARFMTHLSKLLPIVLGVSFFVPKPGTPLEQAPFLDPRTLEDHLRGLKQSLGKRVEVRNSSTRTAWLEHQLAHGDLEVGLKTLEAFEAGGGLGRWRRALMA